MPSCPPARVLPSVGPSIMATRWVVRCPRPRPGRSSARAAPAAWGDAGGSSEPPPPPSPGRPRPAARPPNRPGSSGPGSVRRRTRAQGRGERPGHGARRRRPPWRRLPRRVRRSYAHKPHPIPGGLSAGELDEAEQRSGATQPTSHMNRWAGTSSERWSRWRSSWVTTTAGCDGSVRCRLLAPGAETTRRHLTSTTSSSARGP